MGHLEFSILFLLREKYNVDAIQKQFPQSKKLFVLLLGLLLKRLSIALFILLIINFICSSLYNTPFKYATYIIYVRIPPIRNKSQWDAAFPVIFSYTIFCIENNLVLKSHTYAFNFMNHSIDIILKIFIVKWLR